MYELKIGEKLYSIKYAYTVTVKSGLVEKIAELEFNNDVESSKDFFNMAQNIMSLLPESLLIGLQKFHKDEFGYNYDTGEGKEKAIEKVNDLLDELFDDEENNCFDLYEDLNRELMENGFLKQMILNLQKQLEEMVKEQEKAEKSTTRKKKN